ncbi:MAG: MliC family protein [Bacteroidota bacterium]|nr:MliC family protein [Bacteroidota bacterium]
MENKIKRVSILVLFLTSLSGCTNHSQPKEKQVTQQQIIKGALKSDNGEKLYYTFNNAANTMEIQFKGETITLQGQPTGSGIKYANDHFTYTEWQGNSTLEKDGVIVFEIRKERVKTN